MSRVDMLLDSRLLKNLTLHSEEISFLQFLTNLLTTVFTWPLEALFMAVFVKFSTESQGNPRSVVRVFIIITSNKMKLLKLQGIGSLWVKEYLLLIQQQDVNHQRSWRPK